MPTILHADWSNRPRTAFRRWTQAVHQVAAIQVGRLRFLACPYRFLAAKRQRKQTFLEPSRTTELPSNPSPLTFRNNQIQILQTSSTHATWQPTSLSKIPTHTGRGCHTHAHTYNARQRDKSADRPATHSRTGGEINVVCLLYTSPSPRD